MHVYIYIYIYVPPFLLDTCQSYTILVYSSWRLDCCYKYLHSFIFVIMRSFWTQHDIWSSLKSPFSYCLAVSMTCIVHSHSACNLPFKFFLYFSSFDFFSLQFAKYLFRWAHLGGLHSSFKKRLLKDLRWYICHHSLMEKSAGLQHIWVVRRSPVRFRPKPRQLKSVWIWANRQSSKGSKLLFPVIKANKIKFPPIRTTQPSPESCSPFLFTVRRETSKRNCDNPESDSFSKKEFESISFCQKIRFCRRIWSIQKRERMSHYPRKIGLYSRNISLYTFIRSSYTQKSTSSKISKDT